MEQKCIFAAASSPTQIGVFIPFLSLSLFHFVFLSFHFISHFFKISFIIIGDNARTKFGGGNTYFVSLLLKKKLKKKKKKKKKLIF